MSQTQTINRTKIRKLIQYTPEDVSQHKQKNDAWVILNGWVLDITPFFSIHPGGESILYDYMGQDITQIFRDPKFHVHSVAAHHLIKKFKIGYLKSVALSDIEDAENEKRDMADYGVDIDRGLVWQAAKLGSEYGDFIENTFLVDSQQLTLKIFDNVVCEYLTRSPWYTVPIVWIPLLVWGMKVAVNNGFNPWLIPVVSVFGVLLWMFIEYTLHRFIFHMKTNNYFLNCAHFMLHGYHHIAPMDPFRLTFPPVPALIIASMIFSILRLLFVFETAVALMSGIAIGYIIYDCEHYALHHNSFLNRFTYFRNLKRHHLYHHYKNDKSNYGISSVLFDYVFSSFDPVYLKNSNTVSDK